VLQKANLFLGTYNDRQLDPAGQPGIVAYYTMEPISGIEPEFIAYETIALPLNYMGKKWS